jgi:hypothetical protein
MISQYNETLFFFCYLDLEMPFFFFSKEVYLYIQQQFILPIYIKKKRQCRQPITFVFNDISKCKLFHPLFSFYKYLKLLRIRLK